MAEVIGTPTPHPCPILFLFAIKISIQGSRPNMKLWKLVVSIFFNKLLNNETIVVHGDGLQTRSFTWIDDVTDGFVKAGLLEKGVDGSDLSGLAFNIGSTEEITISQLAQKVVSTSGKEGTEIEFGTGYFGDSKRRLPDIEGAEKILGWQPTVDLQQGLQMMWNELTEN